MKAVAVEEVVEAVLSILQGVCVRRH
jgi:hypothetical protein